MLNPLIKLKDITTTEKYNAIDFNITELSGNIFSWTSGFLNNSLERLPDNNYYQYFSYSIKSNVDMNTWDEAVSTLNHPSGFMKFSDMIIESTQQTEKSIIANNSDNTTDCSEVHIPYACKLMLQEFETMGIAARLVTEKVGRKWVPTA